MESVPKETETIIHKRAFRIAEKLRDARAAVRLKNSWLADQAVELFSLFVLFSINFVLMLPLIGTPAVSVHFSGPILPLLAKIISLIGPPFAYSVQLVNVIFFLVFPVSFYFFVKFVSGRKFAAFLSSLVVTLPIFIFAKSRFEFGLLSNESAYIASLAVLPVALVALLKFLREGGVNNLIYATLITALVALISPFGIFVFVITSIITTFSEVLLGDGRLKILRLLTTYIFSLSLTSFWYTPGFFYWVWVSPVGDEVKSMLGNIIPISFFAVPVLAVFGYLIFDRKPGLQPFFLSLFYTLAFFIIVLAGTGFVPSNPGRYIPVLGASLSFLIGIATLMIFESFKINQKIIWLQIKGIKDAFLILVSLGLTVFIISSRTWILDSNNKVLGIWTDVKKGDIWIARDKLSVKDSFSGYIISFAGAGTLAYLSKKREVTDN